MWYSSSSSVIDGARKTLRTAPLSVGRGAVASQRKTADFINTPSGDFGVWLPDDQSPWRTLS